MKKGDSIELDKLSNGEYKAEALVRNGTLHLNLYVKAEKPELAKKIFLATPTFRILSELGIRNYTEAKVSLSSCDKVIMYSFFLPKSLKEYVEERFDITAG